MPSLRGVRAPKVELKKWIRAAMGSRSPVGGRKDRTGVHGLNDYECSETGFFKQ